MLTASARAEEPLQRAWAVVVVVALVALSLYNRKKAGPPPAGMPERMIYYLPFFSSLVSFLSRKRNVVARQFTFIIIRPPTFFMSATLTLLIFTMRGRLPTATKKLATLK